MVSVFPAIQQVVASLKHGETGEPIHRRKWDSTVMDLPVVNQRQQRRPSLKVQAVNKLVTESKGKEQALYVLLGATGMRISEALALETSHFINDGRSIEVRQQVDRDNPRIVNYLKTDGAYRQIDLSTRVAEYLRAFTSGKNGLLFQTRNGTPYLHNNLQTRWLNERLKPMASMSRLWAGMHSVDSEKHGFEGSVARRTSTTSGWDISRKRCRNSIPAWMRNSNRDSKKRK